MEANRKKGNGLVIFLVVLLLGITMAGTLVFTGVINSPFIKCDEKETKCDTTTKEDGKKSATEETSSYKLIEVDQESLSKTDTNKLATIKLGDKEYDITSKYKEEVNGTKIWNNYIGDKQVELNKIDSIVVFDNSFVVLRYDSTSTKGNYLLKIYDKDLSLVDEDFHLYTDGFSNINIRDEAEKITVNNNIKNSIIDDNHMLVTECYSPSREEQKGQDYIEKLITFKDGKYSVEEIIVVKNIFCSAQR